MKKYIASIVTIAACFITTIAWGASPAFENFKPGVFTRTGNTIQISSSATNSAGEKIATEPDISAGLVPFPASALTGAISLPGTVSAATNDWLGRNLVPLRGATTSNAFNYPLLLDCDPGVDVDELGLLMMAGNTERLGLFRNIAWTTPIRAVDGTCYTNSAIFLDVFARNYGLNGLPIGINAGANGQTGTDIYARFAATNWPNSGRQYESAVRVWRKALSKEGTNTVVVMLGASAWNLYWFLQSAADDISPLTGQELTSRIKFYMIAAGNWPTVTNSPYPFTEYNYSGFSAESANAWAWLTNRPVFWFGADLIYSDNIYPNYTGAFVKGTRWLRFDTNSLVRRVEANVADPGFPLGEAMASLLLTPECFNGTTGTIYNIFMSPFVSPYVTNYFTTNINGNHVFWRVNTNNIAKLTNSWDALINQPYAEQTRAYDTPYPMTASALPTTFTGWTSQFYSNGLSGDLQVLASRKVSWSVAEIGAPDGKRFTFTTNTAYEAINLASGQGIRTSQNSDWWGTQAATLKGHTYYGFYISSGLGLSGLYITNSAAPVNPNTSNTGMQLTQVGSDLVVVLRAANGTLTTNKVTLGAYP